MRIRGGGRVLEGRGETLWWGHVLSTGIYNMPWVGRRAGPPTPPPLHRPRLPGLREAGSGEHHITRVCERFVVWRGLMRRHGPPGPRTLPTPRTPSPLPSRGILRTWRFHII